MIGFVFQQYNLLPRLSILENVELPLLYAKVSSSERRERAMKQLERVGLQDKCQNRPNQLSGGQQQRVSIARALAGNPAILLADEPTGALDSRTSGQILRFFKELNEEGNTIVMITHDNSIALQAKRVVRITDGKINFDGPAAEYAEVIRAGQLAEARPAAAGKLAEVGRPEETGRPEEAGKPEEVGRTEEAGRTEETVRPEEVG